MPLKWLAGIGITARTVGAALITGAILHILTTLLLARSGAGAPVVRIAQLFPANQMTMLPAAEHGNQLLPFQPADSLLAICPLDSSRGPISVAAVLPGPGWLFALFDGQGDNFYTVLGQESRKLTIALNLMPSGEQFVPLPRDLAGLQTTLQLPMPTPTGLMMVAGPVAGLAYRRQVEAELKAASCQLRTR